MAVLASTVKELRDRTGVSIMECKKALEESGGDMEKALEGLARRGVEVARKKSDRSLGAGTVSAYVHNRGQVGTLVLLSCETDFVSKNAEFVALARDIAMHASAMQPESEVAVLEQPFIKDSSKTVGDLLAAATQKFGERIEISKIHFVSVR